METTTISCLLQKLGLSGTDRQFQGDYIDLYQVHWPDASTSFSETAVTLQELLHRGKIRAIGVSDYTPEQMKAFKG